MLIQQILLEVKNMISSLKSAGANYPGNSLRSVIGMQRNLKSNENLPGHNFVFLEFNPDFSINEMKNPSRLKRREEKMKRILFFVLMLLIAVNTFGIDVWGNQSGAWTLANSPYNVIGDVTVISGTSLTIEQGVIVNFDSDTKITIYGDLQAIGSLTDSIYFKSDTSWQGIKIMDTNNSNLIYCVVSDSDDSGLTISNSDFITIQYCHVHNNSSVIGGGINIISGSHWNTIESCKIDNNLSSDITSGGGGIAVTEGCVYNTIAYCLMYENTAAFYGGGILVNESGYTTISMNEIIDNTAVYGGGISICKGVHNDIANNIITQNDAITISAKGGGIYLLTACHVIGNYISHNTSRGYGGGICAEFWSVEEKIISYNSIFENYAELLGGGVFVSGFPRIENCYIYSNTANISGGGIWAGGYDDGVLEIDHCDIHHNKALTNKGGGVFARVLTPLITRSVISFNEANEGGGLYIVDEDDISVAEPGISIITNSIVYGNKAYEQFAGLVACGEEEDLYAVIKCKNSVFFNNTVNDDHEIDLCIKTITNQSYDSVVKYNCISPNGLCIYGDPDEVIVEFNISEDPVFANPSLGNYNISGYSSCIDKGDPDSDEDGEYWTVDEDDQDPDGTRLDIGRYYFHHIGDIHHFSEGIQWVSFPHLTQQGFYNGNLFEKVYYENGEPGLFQLSSNGPCLIDGFKRIVGKDKSIIYGELGFIPFNFGNMLFRHEGYKVEVAEGAEVTSLQVEGDLLTSYTWDVMPSLENFWLGYYVPYPQNIEDAFGDVFIHVNRVWAEDWFYDAMYIQRGLEPSLPSNSTAGKTMDYGKMYIVQMYETVYDFSWNCSGIVEESPKRSEPQNFDYTEKMDYEVIDVIDIPANIIEIGVFEEDVCVGAVVVEDSCAQILVYSGNANREGSPFTFEYVSSRGNSTQLIEYLVFNPNTGEFEASEIIPGRQLYSAIKFTDFIKPEENIMPSAKLYGNYPNPFNPETKISFSIPIEQKIKLTIYNLKGQKVKELINGQFISGTHSVIWNGTDENGKKVGSGLYLYRLKTDKLELTRKMLLLK